ncbi:MAG: phosphoribosylformylglycinamidine cyclo-ligase [Candidatus Cloacimonadota bacterium]|nr:phosphoribosylformylglycinamidine cyclo-ligase [Candidatus Cloacimonadota bacterium]
MKAKISYKNSGVDITAGEKTVDLIKPIAKKTFGKNVVTDLGAFGGLYRFDRSKYKDPLLVSSTDGIGTKSIIAKNAKKFDTVGQDLVNHCVDDILTLGATPLFFLDYIGVGKLLPENVAEIVSGLAKACRENRLALIGGETAEMPDIYSGDDFDLVGTIIGVVDSGKSITGEDIQKGDKLIGFSSTGLHTNGYSLARKIVFEKLQLRVDSYVKELGQNIGDALLTIHKSYYNELIGFISEKKINGLAHITGGGIPGNLKRIITDGFSAEVDKSLWKIPSIFRFLQDAGNVSEKEMFSTFNMGIGMIAIVSKNNVDEILRKTNGFQIGEIILGNEEKVKLK